MKKDKKMPSSNVAISCNKAGKTVDRRTIRRRGERLLKTLDLNDSKLSILLCNDDLIK